MVPGEEAVCWKALIASQKGAGWFAYSEGAKHHGRRWRGGNEGVLGGRVEYYGKLKNHSFDFGTEDGLRKEATLEAIVRVQNRDNWALST